MIPNFHRMTEGELMTWWSRYHRPTRADAESVIGDRRKGYIGMTATIANYACNLSVSMACARRETPDSARMYLQHTAMCLERLPSDIQARMRKAGNAQKRLTPEPQSLPIGHPENPNR